MLYLIISAALSVCMFALFRLFGRYGVKSPHAIYLNYAVCTVVGLTFRPEDLGRIAEPASWWPEAMVIALLFVFTFVVMSRTVQTVGITVATVSAKLSMVIPILANLFFLNSHSVFGPAKWLGMALALVAVVLCTWPAPGSENADTPRFHWRMMLLPAQLFLQAGTADTLINMANQIKLQSNDKALFTSFVYLACAIISFVMLAISLGKGERLERKTFIAAVALGLPNYFSLYFLVQGLEALDNNGALAYPVINLLTILGAAAVALVAFKDKFGKLNWIGLLLALTGIVLLS